MSGVLSAAVAPPGPAVESPHASLRPNALTGPITPEQFHELPGPDDHHPDVDLRTQAVIRHVRHVLCLGRADGRRPAPADPPHAAGTFLARGVPRLLRDPAGRVPALDLLRDSRPEPGPHRPPHRRPPGRAHPGRGCPPAPPLVTLARGDRWGQRVT